MQVCVLYKSFVNKNQNQILVELMPIKEYPGNEISMKIS